MKKLKKKPCMNIRFKYENTELTVKKNKQTKQNLQNKAALPMPTKTQVLLK